jgi:hypothetical protein
LNSTKTSIKLSKNNNFVLKEPLKTRIQLSLKAQI